MTEEVKKPSVSEVPFREQGVAQPISQEVLDDHAAGEGILQEMLGKTARYKIEVMFGRGRTTVGPNACAIRIFESGKALHGGGDVQLPFCSEADLGHPSVGHVIPKPRPNKSGCGRPIPADFVQEAVIMSRDGRGAEKMFVAHCPTCGGDVPMIYLATETFLKVTTDKLAMKLATLWRQLDGDADVYLKYSPGDIRYQACEDQYGGERARELRGRHIYDLPRILTDTGAGADLVKRFEAFLRS